MTLRKACWIVAFLSFTLVGHRGAHAGTVDIDVQPGPGADFAAQLGIDLTELETRLRDELEGIFQVVQPKNYLRALADATAFSGKGLGVDYASNPQVLSVGAGVNISVGFGDKGFDEPRSDQPVLGLAANFSIMAGGNLEAMGIKGMDKLNVYANYFTRTGSIDQLTATLTNMGVHAQYKLIAPKKRKARKGLLVEWGGLDLITGFQYSHIGLRLEEPDLDSDVILQDRGGSGDEDVRFTASGKFDLSMTTYSIPLEAATNLRVFYFVSLFGGVGVDIQVGKSEMDVDLDGTLYGIDPTTQQEMEIGTAQVTVTEDAEANPGKLRFFGGIQVNAWRAHAFMQVNVAPDQAVGLTFGARAAW